MYEVSFFTIFDTSVSRCSYAKPHLRLTLPSLIEPVREYTVALLETSEDLANT